MHTVRERCADGSTAQNVVLRKEAVLLVWGFASGSSSWVPRHTNAIDKKQPN